MSSSSSTWILLLSLIHLLCSSYVSSVNGGGKEYYVEGDVSSLLPPENCSPENDSSPVGSSMRVSHRYGPCSAVGAKAVSLKELQLRILARDDLRVSSLNDLVLNSSAIGFLQANLPTRRGIAFGTGNYILTLSLGTPKQTQTVVFDTGSTVSWIQCRPCLVSCHPQVEPIFNPAASSTYRTFSCNSFACSLLSRRGCFSPDTCLYGVDYADGSSTVGFLVQDTLTLASDAFPGFVYGCGQNNRGLFGNEAGLFGLSRGALSLSSQTSSKYGSVFSYCLPSSSAGTGDLTLGPSPSPVAYTPLLTDIRAPSLYFVALQSIRVGGVLLPVPSSVFSTAGTLLDSGTIVTRLPRTAYAALRAAFRAGMTQYRLSEPVSLFDTCYDFTGRSTISVPAVAMTYGGGVTVNLAFWNIMYLVDLAHVCLAFAGNSNDTSLGIVGNIQQAGQRIVYDVGASRIGFGSGACG